LYLKMLMPMISAAMSWSRMATKARPIRLDDLTTATPDATIPAYENPLNFGEDPDVAIRSMHAPSHSPVTEALLQVGVGLPVYLLCTWLALRFVRFCVATRRRRTAGGPGPVPAVVSSEDDLKSVAR